MNVSNAPEPTAMTTTQITAIKSDLRHMVTKLHTAKTYQQALSLWQSENRQLTEAEANQVMGIAKAAASPFG